MLPASQQTAQHFQRNPQPCILSVFHAVLGTFIVVIVNASARPPRHAGWQGSRIEGEIEAEMAEPSSERSPNTSDCQFPLSA